MAAFDSAKRVISGTWGEVWLDSEKVAECYGLQAKISYNKEPVNRCGQMGEDYKVTSYKGTGTLRLHKVNSRMVMAVGPAIRNGKDIRFTITSKVADPDSYGAERFVLSNVSFDDLTIADWEAAKKGSVEVPFTFTDYTDRDVIEL